MGALIILLYRCAVMLDRRYNELDKKVIVQETDIPLGFREITDGLKVSGNSIEHIGYRAYGKITPSIKDIQTVHSIFTQNEFFAAGTPRYGCNELDMGNDMLQLLM